MNLQKILEKHAFQKDHLIEILIDLQNEKTYKFVTEEEVSLIADALKVPVSHVCGVMSFYTLLSFDERGKYIIQVCKDVPCYLNDDFNVLTTIEKALDISCGDTSKDQFFTLEQTACLGCCDEAPAMRINNKVYTKLTKAKVLRILEEYKEGILC
ncbi:MAG: NAD(P)H-dependent oxidoreductase subunit E [Candidatus Izimaplasma sp.]|nr:NAD(P)H-dependent oxidoreductase subunit E [Candidatus Izimaplasma bacterium]